VHFLQIWIVPDERQRGLPPAYAEGRFRPEERQGTLRLIVSGDGRAGSVPIRQDADLYATRLAPGDAVTHGVRPGRGAWVHVASGGVDLNGHELGPGDGAAIEAEPTLQLVGREQAEVVLFDLP
jgi:redox-sensitive bicupin YhaK (pirin superfamily)